MRPLLALFTALLLLGSGGAVPHLRVTTQSGDVILDIPLADDPSWYIAWNHSVTGILVKDYYRYENGQMLLTQTHTPTFDAGLGHIPGRGRLESDGDHGYWIRDIDEPVPGNRYLLRVASTRVDHRVVHGGIAYSLSERAAGQRVVVEVIE
ncbi:MAG TPA: DUF1850 domain-containing protein [Trueperaceae bacterium]